MGQVEWTSNSHTMGWSSSKEGDIVYVVRLEGSPLLWAPSRKPNDEFQQVQLPVRLTQSSQAVSSASQSCPKFVTPRTAAHQAYLSITNAWACSKSCSSSWWCHPVISSSVVPVFTSPQALPATESFPMSQLFAWVGQSIGTSASASVLPMNIQDWFPLGLTALISFQSKGLSRVFSNTTVQKHQFFGAQPSSQSNSYIHTRPQEKP